MPADPTPKTRRRYRGKSLILKTTLDTKDGVATLTDFMPPRFQDIGSEGTSGHARSDCRPHNSPIPLSPP
jgi:hypothetical protein